MKNYKKNKLATVTKNIFGASVVSLIAACGDKTVNFGISDFDSDVVKDDNKPPTGEDPSQNNLSAPSLTHDFDKGIPNAEVGDSTAAIILQWNSNSAAANVLDIGINPTKPPMKPVADIYQLVSTIENDLVVSAPQFKAGVTSVIDTANEIGTKGAHYIYWNIKPSLTPNIGPSLAHLEVIGAQDGDHIGKYMPVFMNVNKGDGFDMIIRSDEVDFGARTDAGAVYILWNVATYKGTNTAVTLDANASNNILVIYGANAGDKLAEGNEHNGKRVSLLDIGKKTANLDMLIESKEYNNKAGAFYILWDVADYAGSNTTIDLSSITADKGLAIHGAVANDRITLHDPEFLLLGGNAANLDMVIRSQWITSNNHSNAGAIYILWDIDTITTTTIDLGALVNNPNVNSLTIAGNSNNSYIGSDQPKFVYMSNDNSYDDMIVTSGSITYSSPTNAGDIRTNAGAIFVLWDIDNYKNSNTVISVGSTQADNVLSIYGDSDDYLGSAANNVLYTDNGELSDIDGNRTNDIAFQSASYTYVLFGEKVSEADINGNVTSKTIDLNAINDAFTASTTINAGYFEYEYGDSTTDPTATLLGLLEGDKATGYRFGDRDLDSLSGVEGVFNGGNLVSDHSDNWDIV